MSTRETRLDTFDRWSPTAFVLGGLGLLGTSVVGSLDVTGVMSTTPRLTMGPILFGLWFVFTGLIGLYPRLGDHSRRLTLAGVWTAGIAWVAWTMTLSAAVIIDLTSERTLADPGSWAPPLLAGAFVLALLSFLFYGLASTRTRRPSRTFGLLLLVPVAAFLGQALLLASKIVTGDVVAVLQLAFGGVIAIVLISLGYLLRSDPATAYGTKTPAEVTH